MQKVTITITPAQYEALRQVSITTGIGFSELIRRAIDHYLAAPELTSRKES